MRADSKVSAKKWSSRRCFAYNTLHLRVEELKSLRAALRILMLSSKHFIKAALKALCSQDVTIRLKKLSVIAKPQCTARTGTHTPSHWYNYFCLLSLTHQSGEKSTKVNCYSIKVKIFSLMNYS